MLTIQSEPLTAESFAPYGHVTPAPNLAQRIFMDAQLVNRRAVAAKASLSLIRIPAQSARPLPLAMIERHEFSSQTFVPLDAGRYLVLVADKRADGMADLQKLRAFIANSDQAMTYNADIWHGPMTPLDGDMRFAIQMFLDGVSGDEEVIRYDTPFAMLAL